jgi:deoxyxylulose-5-phosphate synthase
LANETSVEVVVRSVQVVNLEVLSNLAELIFESGVTALHVVENHYVRGGVGTYLVDALHETNWIGRVRKYGFTNEIHESLGSVAYLEERFSLGV